MTTVAATAPRRRLHRLERPALMGVLVREVVNFSSFWRSSTFSSVIDPTIYLLAFGFGFGSLVASVAGYTYLDFVGTGIVATTVLFSGAFPAMYGTYVKYAFQHTYDAYPILDDKPIPQDKLRDRAYEQANTYSDVVGLDAKWLNLVWLNFGFHNAHHERPVAPWYSLPRLHRELYADTSPQVVTVGELLRAYHRHRVTRVLAKDYGIAANRLVGNGVASLAPEASNNSDEGKAKNRRVELVPQ